MNLLRKTFNKYDYLIFILVFSLFFGILGGSIQVVRIIAILMFPIFAQSLSKIKKHILPYIYVFLLFECYGLLSLIWTPDFDEGLKELIYYPIHFVILLEILSFSFYCRHAQNTISVSWLFCIIATLLVAYWEIITDNHLPLSTFEEGEITVNIGFGHINRKFAAVTFGNFNGYVKFICFALPFIFYQLFSQSNKVVKYFTFITIFLSSLCVIINASRGGLLAILVMVVLYIILSPKSFGKYFSIFLLFLIGVYLYTNYSDLFVTMIFKSGDGNLTTDDSRIKVWSISLSILLSTLGFGTGIGGMEESLKQMHVDIPFCHNLFIEILLQYGVVFFFIFIIYLVKILFKSSKSMDFNCKYTIYIVLFSLPFSCIIDSGYLLDPVTFIMIGSLSVFSLSNQRCLG